MSAPAIATNGDTARTTVATAAVRLIGAREYRAMAPPLEGLLIRQNHGDVNATALRTTRPRPPPTHLPWGEQGLPTSQQRASLADLLGRQGSTLIESIRESRCREIPLRNEQISVIDPT
jgi:hypothetical protein